MSYKPSHSQVTSQSRIDQKARSGSVLAQEPRVRQIRVDGV